MADPLEGDNDEISSYYDSLTNGDNLEGGEENTSESNSTFDSNETLTLQVLADRIDYIYKKQNRRMLKIAKKSIVGIQRTDELKTSLDAEVIKVSDLQTSDTGQTTQLNDLENRLASVETRLNNGSVPDEGNPFETPIEEIPAMVEELTWKKNVLTSITSKLLELKTSVNLLNAGVHDDIMSATKENVADAVEEFITETRFMLTLFDLEAVLMFVARGYYVLTIGDKSYRLGDDLTSIEVPANLHPKLIDVIAEAINLYQHYKSKLDDVTSRINFYQMRGSSEE